MSYAYMFPQSLPGYRLGADVGDFGQDFAGASDSAGDLVWTFPVTSKLELRRFGVLVTETVAGDSTAPVLKLWKNGTSGTLIDSITVPDATASGKFVYVDLAGTAVEPGDRIDVELDVKATDSGTAAGQGFMVVEADYYPEVTGNLSNVIESA